VRSGINNVGTEKFGGPKEVSECEAWSHVLNYIREWLTPGLNLIGM
jgi:hypothetical protein